MRRIESDNTKSIAVIIFVSIMFLAFWGGEFSRTESISFINVLLSVGVTLFIGGLFNVRYKITTQKLLIIRMYGIWIQKRELKFINKLYHSHEKVTPQYSLFLGFLSNRSVHKKSYRILKLKFNKPWETIKITEQSVTSESFDILRDLLQRKQKQNCKNSKNPPKITP